MRKRLRDWPQKVYKFKCYPLVPGNDLTQDLPQAFWDIAKGMQKLWNDLCDLRESVFPSNWYQEYVPSGETRPQGDAYKIEYRRRQEILQKNARKMQQASGLPWDCRQEVEDRFFRACTKGKTKKHFRLDRINMPYIDKLGGSPLDRVFTHADRLRVVEPVPDQAFEIADRPNDIAHKMLTIVSGRFDMGPAAWKFRVRIHRKIPHDVFIKRIHWIGERTVLGWEWYWALTVEYQPEPKLQSGEKVCAIDLGWRKIDNYLRIGVLVDQDGKIEEIKLPLIADTYRTRRALAGKYAADAHTNQMRDWRQLAEYQSLISQLMDACKADVKQRLNDIADILPTEIKQMLPKLIWDKVRDNGLRKIMLILSEYKLSPEIQRMLSDWRQKNLFMRKRLEATRQYFIRRRDHIYHLLAHDICKRFNKIIWEKSLGIKQMAEQQDDPGLINAGKYRQYAAVAHFRDIITQTAKKYDCEILGAKTAFSTTTCAYCEEDVKSGSALELICKNGHRLDQDVNAALMLGREFFDNFKSEKVLAAIG